MALMGPLWVGSKNECLTSWGPQIRCPNLSSKQCNPQASLSKQLLGVVGVNNYLYYFGVPYYIYSRIYPKTLF